MTSQRTAASISDFNGPAKVAALVASLILMAVLGVAPAAQSQTFTNLHNFTGGAGGAEPIAGVAMDAAGNLYGTTYQGGASGLGMVYKLTHKGSGWVLSELYSFQSGNGGNTPIGGVTIGRDGNLYGTTVGGGQYGNGTVYKLSPPPTVCKAILCPWTETVLYHFTGGADGGAPDDAVIFDSAGNLYGSASYGGTANSGVVFKLTRYGSNWGESVLYSFAGTPDGWGPWSSVSFDSNGNLYGTTLFGGTADAGAVYQLSPSGSGWTEKVIYSFQGTSDGNLPYAGITVDPQGNLYGATFYGGAEEGGAIYELTPSDGNWTFNLVYSPSLVGLGGAAGTLARASDGTLYGTLLTGGNTQSCSGYGCGSVFQLTPSNGGWVYTTLYEFTGAGDGGNPEGGLILDAAGNLYGTTTGDLAGSGTVFKVAP